MSHIDSIALTECLGSARRLCTVHELQTNVSICLMLACEMRLACYGINTLTALINHVHCTRNRDVHNMIASVINMGVEPHLMCFVFQVEHHLRQTLRGDSEAVEVDTPASGEWGDHKSVWIATVYKAKSIMI